MKTKTNIQTVKAMINVDAFERITLATSGVQAYNVFDGQEYTNLISVEKRGGRYYFIDVVGNAALISRYHDAERVCGEFIALYNEELAVVREYIKAMKKHGKVTIKAALWSKFYDECEAQGVKAEYIEGSIKFVTCGVEEYVIESHRLVTGGNDEPKDETMADETKDAPKADNEPKDAPKADNEPKGEALGLDSNLDEKAPFIIWQVIRRVGGRLVVRKAGRSARHSFALNRIKDELTRLNTEYGTTYEKKGRGYYFSVGVSRCMMCVTKCTTTKEEIKAEFAKNTKGAA